MKYCPTCQKEKEYIYFARSKNRKDGLNWQCKECYKTKYQNNKNKILLKNRISYKNNKSNILKKQKEWRKNNKHSILLRNRARRDKIKNFDTIKQKTINNMLNDYNHKCYYCKDSIINNLHIDHYIPLCKGGEHNINNLVPSCKKCNLSKGTKLVTEWINNDN